MKFRALSLGPEAEKFIFAMAALSDCGNASGYNGSRSCISTMQRELFKLLFQVLPDRGPRSDISPQGIGLDGTLEGHTLFSAKFGSFEIEYSASPNHIVIRSISLTYSAATLLNDLDIPIEDLIVA